MKKDDLSPAKKALLEKWLKGKHSTSVNQAIPSRSELSDIQLSFSQQRQLFLEMLDHGTAVNNLSALLSIKGQLDIASLEKSASEIIKRHEVLRTRFVFDLGAPKAHIDEYQDLAIDVVDLRYSESQNKEIEALALAEKDVLIPFDLKESPLLRLKLYKLEDNLHYFLFTVHHAIGDGWSLGVFLRELIMLYGKYTSSQDIALDKLPIQYYDYTLWQTSEDRYDELKDSIKYWKNKLAGELPILQLPTDEKRGSRQTFNGSTYRFKISQSLTEKIDQLSRQEDVTLFMSLLSAFYVLLHRYSDQEDLLVGSPIANRHRSELEPMIGMFINVLVLRTLIDPKEKFSDLLKKVKTTSTEAFTHQNVPFEKLVEELKPRRDLSRTPLFQVMFNLQNSPLPDLNLANLETDFININRGVSEFDLTLIISKTERGCQAAVEYNCDLFHEKTIKRLFDSFEFILNTIVDKPNMPLCDIPIERDGNSSLIELHQYRNFNSHYPEEKCFHQLFEEQVNLYPEDTAVIFDKNKISYKELNNSVNRLAQYLLKIGVVKGDNVGVLLKRSDKVLEALLAIHKIGAAYVPVYLHTPTKRLNFILEDAKIKVLVTSESTGLEDVKDITIVDPFKAELNSINEMLDVQIDPECSAYTIYTSGSTGTPKGVVISHRSLTNFLWSMKTRPGIEKKNKLLAVTSISFDIAALELFLPLISGATVVIASEEQVQNPHALIELIDQHKIDVMQATPATWHLILEAGWPGNESLKALCGGEAISKNLANELSSRVRELWNMYGPTETTIWSSCAKIEKGDVPIYIGLPIANTQLYVLDRNMNPAPLGVIGELYIGGTGLAKEYLNNESLTKAKFVVNPFDHNSKLFKTGDRARFTTSGKLQVLGRLDSQVKINGHRIELGEIEAILNNHPLIKQSVVIAKNGITGTRKLVAYFLAKDKEVEIEELRKHLRSQLPSYMLPSHFLALDLFPLNASGKIDRTQLPEPPSDSISKEYAAPSSETEEILVEIWQNVLDISVIGVNDNFFELGGASIQSIQIVAKANMYGYKIGIEHIFEFQTISELAKYIDQC